MSKLKMYIVYGILAVLAVCVVSLIFIYTKNTQLAEGTETFNMYYINMNTNTLEVEERAINSVSDQKLMFNTVVEEYFAGSKNPNLGLTLPEEFKVLDKRYQGTTAYIDVAPSYNDMPGNIKILAMGSLVYTLTDLSFINNISVTVGGVPIMDKEKENIALFNRTSVMNNPVISPEKTDWQVVKLYFADSKGTRLVAQERGMEVKQSLSLEYQIVEQLIKGPDNDNGAQLIQTVPSDTKIRDIKTEEGICYVNLSNEFMKKQANLSENLIIYSIVNSLTELESVNKVQFLIEGEKINEYSGDIDFSKTFERNTALMRN